MLFQGRVASNKMVVWTLPAKCFAQYPERGKCSVFLGQWDVDAEMSSLPTVKHLSKTSVYFRSERQTELYFIHCRGVCRLALKLFSSQSHQSSLLIYIHNFIITVSFSVLSSSHGSELITLGFLCSPVSLARSQAHWEPLEGTRAASWI